MSRQLIIAAPCLLAVFLLAPAAQAYDASLRLHQAPPAFANASCRPRSGSRASSAQIYRWTDAQGVVHFADRPASEGDQSVSLAAQRDLRLQVTASGLRLPDALSDRIRAESMQIYKIIRSQLLIPLDRSPELSVALVSDADVLGSLLMVDPELLRSLAGLYVGNTSSVYVLAQRSSETTLQILRHELAHAVLHELLGQAPIWLNEGMASYFEPMQVEAMGAVIPAQADRMQQALALFRTDPDGAFLRQILSADRSVFYGSRSDVMYTSAWAFVSTLMDNRDGQRLLGRLFRALRETPCGSFDSVAFLAANHPEGLPGLAAAVRVWARSEPRDHHY